MELEPLNVLIAEPNDQLRHMLRSALSAAGFRVVNQAHSVEQATCRSFLRQIEAQRPHIAIIAQHFDEGDDGGARVAQVLDRNGFEFEITYVSLYRSEQDLPLWSHMEIPLQGFRETVQDLLIKLNEQERVIRRRVARDRSVGSARSPISHAQLSAMEEGLWRAERTTGTESEDLETFEDREFLNSF